MKANKLESINDVWQRGIFRLIWCFIGWLAAFAFFYIFEVNGLMRAAFIGLLGVVIVPLMGCSIDFLRLKTRE